MTSQGKTYRKSDNYCNIDYTIQPGSAVAGDISPRALQSNEPRDTRARERWWYPLVLLYALFRRFKTVLIVVGFGRYKIR